MSVYLRQEVDTKESSLIRRSINKIGVTSLFALKERKYLNIIDRFVWLACGVRLRLRAVSLSISEIVKEKKNKRVSAKSIAARQAH